ncbi:hypothetical protein GCM10009780_04270 [Actinomadura alba]
MSAERIARAAGRRTQDEGKSPSWDSCDLYMWKSVDYLDHHVVNYLLGGAPDTERDCPAPVGEAFIEVTTGDLPWAPPRTCNPHPVNDKRPLTKHRSSIHSGRLTAPGGA